MPTYRGTVSCERKGAEQSLYLNMADDPTDTGGSDCSAELWVYHDGVVGDLSLSETEDEEELTRRGPTRLVKEYSESRIDVEISGEQIVDFLYEGVGYLQSMRSGGYARDVLLLSGFITEVGVAGWRGKFRNFDRSVSGPETGSGRISFKLKPAACVKNGCRVRPVIVNTSGAIANYDPTDYTPYTT
jgi:hypothetical protein